MNSGFSLDVTAEVWDPATHIFGPAGSLAGGRRYHTATPLIDGRIFVVGGRGVDAAPTTAEVWSPAEG